MAASTPQITASFGAPIKQYPGEVQVTRAVKVKAPGKHFSGLTPAEQKVDYWVTAVEYRERYPFERHNKAWGAAHTGPGIRFVSDTDAIDDPDNKGFWTTLSLFNRWRDQTYQSDREAEKQYLDQLPAAPAARAPAAEKAPQSAPVKDHFTLQATGTHTGWAAPAEWPARRSSAPSGRATRRAARVASRSPSSRSAQAQATSSRTSTRASLHSP